MVFGECPPLRCRCDQGRGHGLIGSALRFSHIALVQVLRFSCQSAQAGVVPSGWMVLCYTHYTIQYEKLSGRATLSVIKATRMLDIMHHFDYPLPYENHA